MSSTEFRTLEGTLLVRYAYGEKFLKNTRSLISMGTTHPVIWFAYSHGFSPIGYGQYTYNRFDLKIHKTISFKYFGKTSLTFRAGFIDRDLPYPMLYNAVSGYHPFSFYSTSSFETMPMNEFVADKYAALFFTHSFGKLLYRSKHFNPQPALAANIGFGSLRHPENHNGIAIRSYEKGYYETGLLIHSLLNIGITRMGIGSFYRLGYYSSSDWRDNFSVKLTVSYVF
jgi:hypothetical protein